jgi:hypothetical protein
MCSVVASGSMSGSFNLKVGSTEAADVTPWAARPFQR